MHWPVSPTVADAREFQKELRSQISIVPYPGDPRYVAGVDAAFSPTRVFAAACLYRYPEAALIEQTCVTQWLRFPYIPGYLSLREGPAIIDAVRKLKQRPDVILVDGQGIAHPRRAGIASYVGVQLSIPSVGCAKTRLVGEYREPVKQKGKWSVLDHEGESLGAVLRTRQAVKPLFVSPGHLSDLESSVRIVLCCVGRYRIPEPLRCADMLSRRTARLDSGGPV